MIKIGYFLIFICLLTSCGVKKTEFFVTPKSSKELVEEVNSRIMHYQWSALQAKAHILTDNQEIITNLSIKTKRDSIIWLSARAFLGIELFRAQLTPDSLYILNKVNKTYFVQPISYFKNLIGTRVSFYDVQDFISNNISIPEEKYNLFLEGENLHLLGDSANYSVDDQYRVYNYKFVENNYSFELTVNDYNEGRNFPKKQTFKFDFQEKIEIAINYLSYEFKGPQKIIFNIPKHYARLN